MTIHVASSGILRIQVMKVRNRIAEISSGPMADIAFLLLIFFLVTTTLDQDQGIKTNLPPLEGIPDIAEKPIHIMVNGNGQILMNDESILIRDVRIALLELIGHNGTSKGIQLSASDDVSYADYLNVYDAIRAAVRIARNRACNNLYGINYDALTTMQKGVIEDNYPLKVSERFVVGTY